MRNLRAIPFILMLLTSPAEAETATSQALDCVVEASRTTAVASPVPGILAMVHVDTGDRVRAGQELARLESSVEAALVAEARVRAEARGEVEAARLRLAFARRKLARLADLRKQHTVSAQEYDEAALEAKLAEAELRIQKEKAALARLALARAEAELKLRSLNSPIDGVVVRRHHAAGEYVKDQPVFDIARLDPLKVTVYVPAARFGEIRPGMRARVRLLGGDGGEYQARVSRVDPVIDAASDLFGVELSLPNPELRIPAGLQCRVRFLTEERSPGATGP